MENVANIIPYYTMQNVSNCLISFPLLASLDKFITSIIKNPDCEGKNFMDALEIYNCSIVNLINLVLQKNQIISKIATNLRVQGGPIFLKQKIDRDKFKKKFQWSNKDIEVMYDLRSEISKNWKRFYKIYRKNKEWFKENEINREYRTENPELDLSRLDFNFTTKEIDATIDLNELFPYPFENYNY
uniref:Uncharacterized protein n=1 Tax=Clastoptera arizonana TaxID=38151 RepID=A0A1B6E9F0_9HEMI